MPAIPRLPNNSINQLAAIIASDLTHREISALFKEQDIAEPITEGNKQIRVARAFSGQQAKFDCSNHILKCLQDLAQPVRFINNREKHAEFLAQINQVLLFSSYKITEEGKLIPVTAAKTLGEAAERANSLHKKLDDRKVHSDVIACCRREFLTDNNYFHTVLEACKSVAAKIRQKTGLLEDGHALVDAALQAQKNGYPVLAINRHATPSEQTEQRGFALMVKGMFSMFRNLLAHDPKTDRLVSEDEALEFLVLASLLHRKLDGAHVTNIVSAQ